MRKVDVRRMRALAVSSVPIGCLTLLLTAFGLPPSIAGAASSSQAGLARAKAALAQALKTPTKIPLTQQLDSKPKRGGSIVYAECDLPNCSEPYTGIKQAAKLIGWKSSVINVQLANPASTVAAMQQALTMSPKPTAVVVTNTPSAVWGTEIPAYQAAGVKIVPLLTTNPVNSTVLGQLGGPAETASDGGAAVGNWFVVHSHGKGHALIVQSQLAPATVAYGNGVRGAVKRNCPNCVVTTVNLAAADFTTSSGTTAAVAALQKDPSIGYLLSTYLPATPGITGALSAAGLSSRVTVAATAGSAADYASVKSGTVATLATESFVYSGWLTVDVVLRSEQGIPYGPRDGGWPFQLFTKSSPLTVAQASNYVQPTNLSAQFTKLWKVS